MMGDIDRPILIFDSGIGGLTVLREARMLMPDCRFIYVADNAAFPYGDWGEEALLAHLLQLFDDLIGRFQPAAVIVACNTAFTLAGTTLRNRFADMVFVGTVPAIKPAAERTVSGLISVFATPATVTRDYTKSLISNFAHDCEVKLIGSKKMAALVEAYICGDKINDDILRTEIAPCFVEKDGRRTDIIVLACTHYPFLTNQFRRLAPWPVDWLNPAESIALQARRVIGVAPTTDNRDAVIFTRQDIAFEMMRLMQGFGLERLALSSG